MRSWISRLPWLPFIAVAFSIYLTLLLTNVYQSQAKLRAAAEARLMADTSQVASLIGDFLDSQRAFARDLADGHAIETFLINQALGMSMQYGLSASLYSIEEDFRQRLTKERILGAPIYSNLFYFDDQGALLAQAKPNGTPIRPPQAPGGATRLRIDWAAGRIAVAAAVDYRGTHGGFVVSVSDTQLLSRFLTSTRIDIGFRQFLIATDGQPLSAYGRSLVDEHAAASLAALSADALTKVRSLPSFQSAPLADVYDLVLRTPVAGSPLSLVTLLPNPVLYGQITSRGFLLFASITPVVLILIALWFDRMRRRARQLEADVVKSNRDRVALRGWNDALLEEIARREALEGQLRRSEERYRTYVEHAPEGIFVSDTKGQFIDANPSACAMVGYSRTELLTMTITNLSLPERRKADRELLKRADNTGQQEVELGLLRKDGSEIDVNLRVIGLPDSTIIGYCVDVTERKRAERQIHHLAFFDPLTGLPNRRLLLDRLHQAMADSRRKRDHGALLMLDLDHFKTINDTQGHDVGDRLLVMVARRLTSCIRHEDTASRFGGDEYVILIKKLGIDKQIATRQAEQIAQKIHEALSQPYSLNDGRTTHHYSASIGLSLFCGQDTPADQILKQADVALYQAKSAGRSTVRTFNPQMQSSIDERASMEAALRQAIDRQELQLYFQPQVSHEGTLIGAEALLRWQPPGGEPVSPSRFIGLSEETGLIVPLGLWVLQQACVQLRHWQQDARTRQLKLSVNVSARQFYQPDFVEQVFEVIRRSEIDAHRLTLELTESVVLDRVDLVIDRMRALKAIGLSFSLDDFGTGYSSLFCLKHLPLDQVKIDRSFVRDITHDQNDAAIVSAIAAMGHALGLAVIAEGVETEAQLALLERLGCEGYQGYLFGKPTPIESLALERPGATISGSRFARPIQLTR